MSVPIMAGFGTLLFQKPNVFGPYFAQFLLHCGSAASGGAERDWGSVWLLHARYVELGLCCLSAMDHVHVAGDPVGRQNKDESDGASLVLGGERNLVVFDLPLNRHLLVVV